MTSNKKKWKRKMFRNCKNLGGDGYCVVSPLKKKTRSDDQKNEPDENQRGG